MGCIMALAAMDLEGMAAMPRFEDLNDSECHCIINNTLIAISLSIIVIILELTVSDECDICCHRYIRRY